MDGRFLIGLPFKGKTYFDFTVRVLTLGGECQALELIEEMGLLKDELSAKEKTLVDLAYLKQQLVVHGIDDADLTPEFLLENLSTDDFVLVNSQIRELRKKRIADGESQSQNQGESKSD